MEPELLVASDREKRTPLFRAVISPSINIPAKERILRCLCGNSGPQLHDEAIVQKARTSLPTMDKYDDGDDDYGECTHNALHLAII
jgi:hypothetical protein